MAEWQGVVNTTARRYLKGSIDLTFRKRLAMKLIESNGRIVLNEEGDRCIWDFEFKEIPIQPFGDGGVLNFARSDNDRQLELDWRGYKGTDLLTDKEELMNKGDVAIIRRYDKIIPRLMKAMRNSFSRELLIDGSAPGNENRLHGLKSFMGDDGATTANDLVARPSQTYAGKSTAPNALGGGSWSSLLAIPPNATIGTDWPLGRGNVQYDCLMPKLVNLSSNRWGTTSTNPEDNIERAMRFMTNVLCSTGGEDGMPDLHLLSVDLFTAFQNSQAAKSTILIPHKRAQDLGFDNVLNFDGVMVQSDFDVDAGEGFTLNYDWMELASLDKVLFRVFGPDWDPRTHEYLFAIRYYGNLRFTPKHFGRFKAYA